MAEANLYLPTVAWRTMISNVILLSEETTELVATYRVTVDPIDINEPGGLTWEAEDIDASNYYLKDFLGHTFKIIDAGTGTVDISDDFRTGHGAVTGRMGIIYKSVGGGTSPYLAPVYYKYLDKSARDYSRRFELDILWKNAGITTIGSEVDPTYPITYIYYIDQYGDKIYVTEVPKPNGLIWGGFVSWLGLLSFSVTPALYYLFAVLYKILDTTVITLDAADPDNPRIDVIAVDNTETVIVIKGTPAANPQKPSIDPETQIELTYVLIPAGATEPEDIDQSVIYDENTEWTGAGSGVTVDFDNATTPFHLSKCASVGTITNNDTITFSTGVPVNVVDFKNLILYLKLKAAMTSQHNLYAAWMRSGVLVSNEVVLPVSKSNVTTWQSIAIQLTSFTWSQSTVDALRLRWSKSGRNVAHAGFYLDFVKLETGIIQQVVNSAIILTGDVTGSGTTGSPVPTTLKTVNSNVGTFGDKSNVPQITVDAKGRVTSVVNVLIGEFGDLDGGCSNTVYLVVQNIDCNL